jgi:hypothetical protein
MDTTALLLLQYRATLRDTTALLLLQYRATQSDSTALLMPVPPREGET